MVSQKKKKNKKKTLHLFIALPKIIENRNKVLLIQGYMIKRITENVWKLEGKINPL